MAIELKKVVFHLKSSLSGQPLLKLVKGTVSEVNHPAATGADEVMVVH